MGWFLALAGPGQLEVEGSPASQQGIVPDVLGLFQSWATPKWARHPDRSFAYTIFFGWTSLGVPTYSHTIDR